MMVSEDYIFEYSDTLIREPTCLLYGPRCLCIHLLLLHTIMLCLVGHLPQGLFVTGYPLKLVLGPSRPKTLSS